MTDKHNTHAMRRAKYGLNVAVAIAAAVVLAILVNWIAYRQTYARWDLTATRAYSLSPQTRQVLNGLDGEYRIVTLFREDLPELTRIRDLVSEYSRRSGNVRVEHLNPDFDIRRRQQLHADVRAHFAQELGPYVQTVEQGVEAIRQAVARLQPVGKELSELLEDESFPAGNTRQRVQQVSAVVGGQQSVLANQLRGLEEALDQSLPDYVAVKERVQELLASEALDRGLLGTAVQWFEQAADAPNDEAPSHAKNALLKAKRELEGVRDVTRAALRELRLAEGPRRYDEALQGLAIQQTVVVFGPGQLRVIPAGEMYREPTPEQRQAGGNQAERRFLGEERLTGALIAMGLEQPPMVVFVNAGRQPAIGRGGMYEAVAERLRSADMRVEQWSPGGRTSPTGQPMPASPPPQAEPGQRTVWVVLPMTDANPMMGGMGKTEVAELLEDRLAKGDAAMVMLMSDPMVGLGMGDPLVDYVQEQWGIRPQLDRLVLREVHTGDGQSQATGQFEVRRWPSELPVSQALAGMQGIFVQTSPVRTQDVQGVTHWPVVELSAQRMWAPRNVTAETLRSLTFDPAESEERFTVGVAAEREDQRLLVFTDPVWASDMTTTYGHFGPGTAELTGQLFPANSELFVNSVYWLADLEGVIAASPRTQDIRRIGAISDRLVTIYYFGLLGGLPIVILAAGLGVWFVRRRG